uniref:HYLS1_C domain-containing protein n=1 Tax=Anopheles atroparvus TaxID=41427 RepID=A0A182INZ8_ANOAO
MRNRHHFLSDVLIPATEASGTQKASTRAFSSLSLPDLRKLIKFDTRLTTSEDQKHSDANTPPETVFERLHSEKTISYQAKVAQTNKKGSLSGISDKENHPAPKLAPHTNNNKPNKMWIRPKSSQSARRGDPVALYHAYQKDWNRFKQKLPGENNHSELRWKIRTKLLGE